MKTLRFESFSILDSKKTGTICSLNILGILSFLSSVYLIYLNMKNKPVAGSTSENDAVHVYSGNANMKRNHHNIPERPFLTAGTFLNTLFRIVDCLSEHFKAEAKVPQGDSGSFRVALCIKGVENQLWKGIIMLSGQPFMSCCPDFHLNWIVLSFPGKTQCVLHQNTLGLQLKHSAFAPKTHYVCTQKPLCLYPKTTGFVPKNQCFFLYKRTILYFS